MAEKKAAELLPVEQLRQENKIPAPVMAGVMTQQGWRKGKCVARADFLAAVKQFRLGKVGG